MPDGNGESTSKRILTTAAKGIPAFYGYYRREALDTWTQFKRLTESKPLRECTRDDGRKLVRSSRSG